MPFPAQLQINSGAPPTPSSPPASEGSSSTGVAGWGGGKSPSLARSFCEGPSCPFSRGSDPNLLLTTGIEKRNPASSQASLEAAEYSEGRLHRRPPSSSLGKGGSPFLNLGVSGRRALSAAPQCQPERNLGRPAQSQFSERSPPWALGGGSPSRPSH